ncbi:MAG: translocation/assembly module TamB domain-containing protein [Bryobacteraceae bacterium]
MSRPLRISLYFGGALICLAGVLTIAALLILPSEWFREKVRERIVAEVEKASGGRAEIGSFQFDWWRMRASVAPFVLRGTEPEGERPLFRAESIEVVLKVVSALKRDIDIQSLIIEKPEANILVDENGRTNLPEPKVKRNSGNTVERILGLAVQEFAARNGAVYYQDGRTPLDVRGENLQAVFHYDLSGPRYEGTVSMRRLHIDAGKLLPVALDFNSRLSLERDRLTVESARFATRSSSAEIAGLINNFRDPHAEFDVKLTGNIAELREPLRLPFPQRGTVVFTGKARYSPDESYSVKGRVEGSGVDVQRENIRVQNVRLTGDMTFEERDLKFRNLRVSALDGIFTGSADVEGFERYRVRGNLAGASVQAISRVPGIENLPWNGVVSGPAEVTGSFGEGARDLKASAKMTIDADQNARPVEGFVEVAYDQRAGTVQLGNSRLATEASKLVFSGTIGEELQAQVETSRLDDLLPALSLISEDAPKQIPVTLRPGGSALFKGTVTGAISEAVIQGALGLNEFTVEKQDFDKLAANFRATKTGVQVESFALGSRKMRVNGAVQLGLENWRLVDASPMAGTLQVQGADLQSLLRAQGQDIPVEGVLSGAIKVEGTVRNPSAVLKVQVEGLSTYGQKFDRARAEIRYLGEELSVISGEADLGPARLFLDGTYRHPMNDYRNGQVSFKVSSRGFNLAQVAYMQQIRHGLQGGIDIQANGEAEIRDLTPLLNTLDGRVLLQNLIVDQRPVGDMVLDAQTSEGRLNVQAKGNLRGSKINGHGSFELAGDYPGSGQVEFSPLAFSVIQDLLSATTGRKSLPVEGFVAGKFTFSGPARKPELIKARLEIPTVEIAPGGEVQSTARTHDLLLRNEGPIVLQRDEQGIHVQSARLTGPETNVTVAGTIGNPGKTAWNLQVNGTVNLALAEKLHPDLLTSGTANIQAGIKGSLSQPQVNGRVEFREASVTHDDLPNGLDKINGIILFDQTRATIEKLTAESGGGQVLLSGFVGFNAGEPSYRLQTRLDGVRVRYPEGVSTSMNASLNLTGTLNRSLLAGVVTLQRASFNPRTDFGGLLTSSAEPIAPPATTNEFLQGMQLDIRIESVPNLQFQTSLTRDIQAEADLRLRGTAARPALLGRVLVHQGEIQFFGTEYTINRGLVEFYNPAKIEPVIDMDLETRVRGVVVNINFAGSIRKLNVSYRSDPPLQSNEIIALLTVGRAPGTTSTLAGVQTLQSGFLGSSSNSLLGQALSTPVSSRLQRFFGISRLKIDPQLTGVNAAPQARLTLEQQISRDITLTYITNLSQANQQIVRVEWNINTDWSLVALREENGVFGVDFLYKRRFRK